MATILDFSHYRSAAARRPGESRAPDAGIKPGPHYFCTRCESDRFRLYSSRTIHCASCGALMRNIAVDEREKSESGSG